MAHLNTAVCHPEFIFLLQNLNVIPEEVHIPRHSQVFIHHGSQHRGLGATQIVDPTTIRDQTMTEMLEECLLYISPVTARYSYIMGVGNTLIISPVTVRYSYIMGVNIGGWERRR